MNLDLDDTGIVPTYTLSGIPNHEPVHFDECELREVYTLITYALSDNQAELCLYQRRKWEAWATMPIGGGGGGGKAPEDQGAGCGERDKVIDVLCPKCGSLHTIRESFGWWRCDDCAHLFEYWNRRDQLDRVLGFVQLRDTWGQ